MSFFGLLIGIVTLFIIGLGFPLVIQGERRFSYLCWPYMMGFGRALIAAYGALGKPCPDQCYFTSPSYKGTRENLADVYKLSFGVPAPQEVLDALK